MIYLVKRGPRPSYHRVPFHPVILCDLKAVVDWETMGSDGHDWVWTQSDSKYHSSGWLLVRWRGLDIDYRPVTRDVKLIDGARCMTHDRDAEPRTLLKGATWWSIKRMPEVVAAWGVQYARDSFTQQRIVEKYAEIAREKEDRKRMREMGPNGIYIGCFVSGIERPTPDFWPEPIDMPLEEVR